MARVYRAVCLRDTVQDNPYQYFVAGKEYMISEDSPVAVHFKPLEELSKKEADTVIGEERLSKPVGEKRKTGRARTDQGPGYAEIQG